MLIQDLVSRYSNNERPVSFFAGYAVLDTNALLLPTDPVPDITLLTDITISEWAIIRPLFILYVERENALHLEASRGMGVDVFGRTTSEISSDIQQLEEKIPFLAFSQPVVTV